MEGALLRLDRSTRSRNDQRCGRGQDIIHELYCRRWHHAKPDNHTVIDKYIKGFLQLNSIGDQADSKDKLVRANCHLVVGLDSDQSVASVKDYPVTDRVKLSVLALFKELV